MALCFSLSLPLKATLGNESHAARQRSRAASLTLLSNNCWIGKYECLVVWFSSHTLIKGEAFGWVPEPRLSSSRSSWSCSKTLSGALPVFIKTVPRRPPDVQLHLRKVRRVVTYHKLPDFILVGVLSGPGALSPNRCRSNLLGPPLWRAMTSPPPCRQERGGSRWAS